MYLIITDRKPKQKSISGYYSRAFGCFSALEQATWFYSWESAQRKVNELRRADYYAYATPADYHLPIIH